MQITGGKGEKWRNLRCLVSLWRQTTGQRRRGRAKRWLRKMVWLWGWARRTPRHLWTLITRKKWRRRNLRSDSISTLTSEPLHAVIKWSLPQYNTHYRIGAGYFQAPKCWFNNPQQPNCYTFLVFCIEGFEVWISMITGETARRITVTDCLKQWPAEISAN